MWIVNRETNLMSAKFCTDIPAHGLFSRMFMHLNSVADRALLGTRRSFRISSALSAYRVTDTSYR